MYIYLFMYIYTAPHSNTLQHICNILHNTVTHCNTLQHTATHCITLQHAAAHCNTLQPIYLRPDAGLPLATSHFLSLSLSLSLSCSFSLSLSFALSCSFLLSPSYDPSVSDKHTHTHTTHTKCAPQKYQVRNTFMRLRFRPLTTLRMLQCVAVCCSVAVCYNVLQCVALCCSMSTFDYPLSVAVCCSVLQCVAVCCSVLYYVAVC